MNNITYKEAKLKNIAWLVDSILKEYPELHNNRKELKADIHRCYVLSTDRTVVLNNNIIIAVILLTKKENSLHIDYFYIHKDYRDSVVSYSILKKFRSMYKDENSISFVKLFEAMKLGNLPNGYLK